MRVAAVGILFAMFGRSGVSHAATALEVGPIANPLGVRIAVQPTSRSGWSLLQIVDPSTGACLKTIHAGRFSADDHFAVVRGATLPPGPYRLRYREGIDLVLEANIARPDPAIPAWLNPTDICLAGTWVYVRDAGKDVEGKTPEQSAERTAREPCIFKMDRAGKLDTTFGKSGRIVFPTMYQSRSFAVDPATGKLFIGSGSHELCVYEASGALTKQTVGGWDNDPAGPKCLAWCDSVALGHNGRIYIPLPGYGNGKVYDRTKNAFEGILYRFDLPDVNGTPRMICCDGRGAVYVTGQSQQITRFTDDEKSLKVAYQSDPEVKLAVPTGGSVSAGLMWWACHGPGPGPYWDSGGGGEVVLFWDTGKEIKLIDRFGVPGAAASGMEFMNPSAAVMDAAHTELWVAEDGMANKEGPKGNARVRRFALKARHTEEVDFNLPG